MHATLGRTRTQNAANAVLWVPACPGVTNGSPPLPPATHPQTCTLSPHLACLSWNQCWESSVLLVSPCLHPSGVPSATSSGDKGTESTRSENQLPARRKKPESLPCMLNCVRERGGELGWCYLPLLRRKKRGQRSALGRTSARAPTVDEYPTSQVLAAPLSLGCFEGAKSRGAHGLCPLLVALPLTCVQLPGTQHH